MTPLGLLGPLAPEWLRENKVIGCPHPHIPSGKCECYNMYNIISIILSLVVMSVTFYVVVRLSNLIFNFY